MNMKNLFLNWKTSSAGLALIVSGFVHIAYCIYHKSMSETDMTTTLLSILGGIGLIAAGDAAVSATKVEMSNVNSKVDATATAVKTTAEAAAAGNTELLKKAASTVPPPGPVTSTQDGQPPKTP